MTKEATPRSGGTRRWWLTAGIAALLTLAIGPALAGSASAAPLQPAGNLPGATQWAYGGQGYDNGSFTLGNATLTWNSSFGWTVIFTATNTSSTTVQLEEQRTVGIDVRMTLTTPSVKGSYSFHAVESDLAFVNLTNASQVYVNGAPVPALGILNEQLSVQASVDQAVSLTAHGVTRNGYLNISGAAQGQVSFSPALGLIPLNLSGVNSWNSSATANPSASWNLSWAWMNQGWNGTSGSGHGSSTGSWNASGLVRVTGHKVVFDHPWDDHRARVAIVLFVEGPVDARDGFILVPHDFDLFGGAAHHFDAMSMDSATVQSGEVLFVSPGPKGPAVTAAATTFGTAGASLGMGPTLATPASPGSQASATPSAPSGQVVGSPMTVSAAQAESQCLAHGCPAVVGGLGSGILAVVLIALAAIAVVGTVAVIEWRSYARRRSQKGLVGGYGESWKGGVPPATSLPPPGASMGNAPSAPAEPTRRP